MAQYPLNAQAKASSLTDTAQTLFAAVAGAMGFQEVSVLHLVGGAAAEIVIFRAEDNLPEYFRVNLAALEDKWIVFPTDRPLAFAKVEGLEVITASAAGDVTVEAYYWAPGAKGIGV